MERHLRWHSGGCEHLTSLPGQQGVGSVAAQEQAEENVVWTSCVVNCGSRCPLRLHVKDGVVVRVETDNLGDDELAIIRCAPACVAARFASAFTIPTASSTR
ncbi:hypothetical protein [Candidatus Flexifilum breve]|uniref:hypothetical protein n=1 Tax=Candidatus Flexifilum breve TaxID=3140694 RepID=UPI0031CC938C